MITIYACSLNDNTVYVSRFEEEKFHRLLTELRKIWRKSFVMNPLTHCTDRCAAEASDEKFCNSMVIYKIYELNFFVSKILMHTVMLILLLATLSCNN